MDTNTLTVLQNLREEVENRTPSGGLDDVVVTMRIAMMLEFAITGRGWLPREMPMESVARMVLWALDVAQALAQQQNEPMDIDVFYKNYPWTDITSYEEVIVEHCPEDFFSFLPIPLQAEVFIRCWSTVMDFLMNRYFPEPEDD